MVGLMLTPPLLADALARVIARRGVKVVRLPLGEEPGKDQPPREPPTRLDVAVLCADTPDEGLPAEVVVCLPEDPAHPWDSPTEIVVADPQGQSTAEVADLEDLVDLIVKLTADC